MVRLKQIKNTKTEVDMRITADSNAFVYTGRIDFEDKKEPLMIYAGSMVETKFTGKSIGIYVKNQSMFTYTAIGVLVDNVQYRLELTDSDEEQFFKVPAELGEGEHTLVVFKRQAAAHYFRFCGIETDDDSIVTAPEKNYTINIEVFGDSVSAGEVTEAFNYEGCADPAEHKGSGVYDNSWFSYPLILGRRLGARVFDNAQGGIALLDRTGFFCGPDRENMRGVESTYDKLSYVPYSRQGITKWDFSRFTPDLIIFAIGQNDHNPCEEETKSEEFVEKWKGKYKEILGNLKKHYGAQVKVIMILTVLMHDPRWDTYLDEIEKELGDETVRHYRFKRCGTATPGHPRLTEQVEMAEELNTYIRDWFGIE